MRKFVKIFTAMVAVGMIVMNAMQCAKAVWPTESRRLLAPKLTLTEDVLYPTFESALRESRAAATYCFYNPDAPRDYYRGRDVLAAPSITPDSNAKKIPVAIRLLNDAAKEAFREYIQSEFISEVYALKNPFEVVEASESRLQIHPYENVFIISFDDLNKLSSTIALYTRNGIPGKPALREKGWCWDRVLRKSCVQARWAGDPRCTPPEIYLAKARVLMKGLERASFGSKIRTCEHDEKLTEWIIDEGLDKCDVVFDQWPLQ